MYVDRGEVEQRATRLSRRGLGVRRSRASPASRVDVAREQIDHRDAVAHVAPCALKRVSSSRLLPGASRARVVWCSPSLGHVQLVDHVPDQEEPPAARRLLARELGVEVGPRPRASRAAPP